MPALTVCHFPAQDLLSLNEMRYYLREGSLPDDFLLRVENTAGTQGLAESPNVQHRHSSPHTLLDLLSWEEMTSVASGEPVPEDFALRVARVVEDDICTNCDGRLCMGCVLRWYYHECAHDCSSCC